jgi:ERCC4-type nuclease
MISMLGNIWESYVTSNKDGDLLVGDVLIIERKSRSNDFRPTNRLVKITNGTSFYSQVENLLHAWVMDLPVFKIESVIRTNFINQV